METHKTFMIPVRKLVQLFLLEYLTSRPEQNFRVNLTKEVTRDFKAHEVMNMNMFVALCSDLRGQYVIFKWETVDFIFSHRTPTRDCELTCDFLFKCKVAQLLHWKAE